MLASIVSFLFLHAPPLLGQSEGAIGDAVRCERCRIRLTPVAQLGNALADGEGGLQGGLTTAARNSAGRLYASYNEESAVLYEHAPDGSVLRTIGRSGAGPMEFQRISALQMDADTIHVFDQMQRRRTVLTPSGAFVRSSPLPGNSISMLLLSKDRQLMNTVIATEQSIGFPLHIITADGAVMRSFGTETPVQRPDGLINLRRKLARSHDGSFWAMHENAYRLERWSEEGALLQRLTRAPAWFAAWEGSRASRTSPTEKPNSYPVGIRERQAGQLWVVVRVPDANWKPDQKSSRSSESAAVYYSSTQPQRAWDTMIELIDTTSGTVIARAKSSGALGAFVDDKHVLRYSADEDGRMFAEIVRIELVP